MAKRSPFPDVVAVVVAERTPVAFFRALRRVEKSAPTGKVAELRLDTLPTVAAMVTVLERLARQPSKLVLIATCRRQADGGEFVGSPSAQMAVLELALRAGCRWVDVDAATLASFPPKLRKVFLRGAKKIVSVHDFRRTPTDLSAWVRRAKGFGADVVKVATLARQHSDAVRLLKLARANQGRLIAVPMGPVGIPGRVLALRAGSPVTFAAADKDVTVAPGQLTVKELRGLYRIHKLNARTRVYGVVGSPALHSLSPALHNAAFAEKKINAVYLPFEVTGLKDFLSCVREYGLAGFSVTAPHKEKILKHLDSIDPIAAMIGAVNTVVVGKGGKLEGYNTDYVGVLRVLARTLPLECSQVLIVGAGGSARACAFALATAGAFVSVTARQFPAAKALARAIGGEAIDRKKLGRRQFDVILNCTPVGQQPRDRESPLRKREINARVVMDLVYRPLETRLLQLAKQRGAKTVTGLDMLTEQGAAQFEIWIERRAPVALMRRAALRALREA